MATAKAAWSHYSFKSSLEFIDFLSNTNLIPPFPKKLSKSCHNFLSLLFTRQLFNINNNTNTNNSTHHNKITSISIEDLIEHEFFTNPYESMQLKDSQSHTMSNHKSSNENKESVNPLPHKNNIVVNILNANTNEDAAMFSVTVTVNTPSHIYSVNTNKTNNVQSVNNDNGSSGNFGSVHPFQKKIIPVLEEIEASKEHSPNIKEDKDSGKNYFEFNSDSENSYNFIRHANERSLNVVNVDSLPFKIEDNLGKIHPNEKYNNFDFVDFISIGTGAEKISSIRPEAFNNKLTYSKVKDLDRLDKEFQISEALTDNIEQINLENIVQSERGNVAYNSPYKVKNPFSKINEKNLEDHNFGENQNQKVSLISEKT